ncbi:Ubiquitin [uncultured virus]|nr:Ubiquitin [uncultured virus]
MQIFVKTLSGKTITIDACPSETVSELKLKIEYKDGVCAHFQRLTHSGRTLEDTKLLQDYHINQDSTVHVHLVMRNELSPTTVTTGDIVKCKPVAACLSK